MKNVKINGYEATDGKLFVDYAECQEYENSLDNLENHITKFCGSIYCGDAGFRIYEPEHIAEYIRNNLAEITNLVNKGL